MKNLKAAAIFLFATILFVSCDNSSTTKTTAAEPAAIKAPEYFDCNIFYR